MPFAAALSEPHTNAGRRDTLRHRLRHATAEAHARLDAQFAALDLQDRGDYRRFLEANAAALLPLEAALAESDVSRAFPDWELRTRRHAILDDLASVGGVARSLPTPGPFDAAGVLGAMYVLEGSRLGARMLVKTAAQSRDPVVAGATAYLGHGAGQDLWPSFLIALEHHGASLRDETGAVDGACCAFTLFAQAAVAINNAATGSAHA